MFWGCSETASGDKWVTDVNSDAGWLVGSCPVGSRDEHRAGWREPAGRAPIGSAAGTAHASPRGSQVGTRRPEGHSQLTGTVLGGLASAGPWPPPWVGPSGPYTPQPRGESLEATQALAVLKVPGGGTPTQSNRQPSCPRPKGQRRPAVNPGWRCRWGSQPTAPKRAGPHPVAVRGAPGCQPGGAGPMNTNVQVTRGGSWLGGENPGLRGASVTTPAVGGLGVEGPLLGQLRRGHGHGR